MTSPRTNNPEVRSLGVSRRAYARARGCSERLVRKHIASGLLKPALLSDGTLDAERADELLGKNLTRSAATPPDLIEARKRKLQAQCRLLEDEVRNTREGVVSRAVRDKVIADTAHMLPIGLRPVLALAPSLAGCSSAEAADRLRDVIYDALTAICDEAGEAVATAAPESKPRGLNLGDLDLTQLAALKADLEGERLELARSISRGEVLEVSTICEEIAGRLMSARAALLAMPTKLAPLFPSLRPDEALATVRDALADACAKIAGPEISAASLAAILEKTPA